MSEKSSTADHIPAADHKPARRGLGITRKRAGQPSRAGAAGRHAQQAARDGAVAVGKEMSERVGDAARKAKAAALAGGSRAKDGTRQWSALDPDVKQQVVLPLLTTAAVTAGEHLKKHDHLGVKLLGVGIVAAAPAAARHVERQVGKPPGTPGLKPQSAETPDGPDNTGSTDQIRQADEAGKVGT